jgi:hypothetical protein
MNIKEQIRELEREKIELNDRLEYTRTDTVIKAIEDRLYDINDTISILINQYQNKGKETTYEIH